MAKCWIPIRISNHRKEIIECDTNETKIQMHSKRAVKRNLREQCCHGIIHK